MAGVSVRLCGLVLLAGSVASGRAQAAGAPVAAPVFAVAAIRPAAPRAVSGKWDIWSSGKDGKFTAANVPLRELLQYAFNVPGNQIVGGPDALLGEKFDIEAKSDPEVDARLAGMAPRDGTALKKRMLQALFAERFKLTTHPETRQLPIYNLGVVKGGPKLKESATGDRKFGNGNDHVEDFGATMGDLADQLAKGLGRVVVDQTGLTKRYDLTLKWTPDNVTPGPDSPPVIYTALEEQLGLRLQPAKGPVPVLVIDHVEAPTEN